MGQANLRGSYEQRKAREQAWLNNLSPEKRKRVHADRASLLAAMALAAGINFERVK